uniref:Synaptogyrin n=1 Tax=Myripristis murdjan TaxID=586833 RepID=A0A667X5T9_9TELE
MEPAGAYGAGKAGSAAFDPVAFFTHPRTILRLLSWVFSMVVFSCIVNEGYINIGSERLLCVFNNNADACNYGVTVGVACFLGSICFLILDIYFPTISSVRDRRRAVLLDLVFSGTNTNINTFLWFVGFCFLANQWQATSPDELPLAQGSDAARATIAFCFFSILTWVCMFVFLGMFTWPVSVYLSPVSICLSGYQCLLAMNRFKNIAFTEDKQRLLPRTPPTLSLV